MIPPCPYQAQSGLSFFETVGLVDSWTGKQCTILHAERFFSGREASGESGAKRGPLGHCRTRADCRIIARLRGGEFGLFWVEYAPATRVLVEMKPRDGVFCCLADVGVSRPSQEDNGPKAHFLF